MPEDKPKFVPGTKYTWEPTAQIVMTGAEFNILYNHLKQIMQGQTNQIQMALMIADIFGLGQFILERNIENGIIIPETQPEVVQES